MMKNYKCILLFVLSLPVFYGCNSGGYSDTPTTGELTISVDETFKPFIDSEISTFESIYTYANVTVNYKPEDEAFYDLMNDSVRLIIVSRKLNDEELKEFQRWEIVPKVTKIAYDGVALIGSLDLKDSTISLDEIKDLISGKGVPSFKNVKVVFDNNNSSTRNFLTEKTGIKEVSENCYALNSNQAVIDYIAKEKNSIGVIGVNWISDNDDTTHLSFLKSAKVLEISSGEGLESFKPYQAYIAQKIYPLWREVYMLSREAYTGLGTGFTSFVASERGQRIVLKCGLVPATMPVRFVELINEEITN